MPQVIVNTPQGPRLVQVNAQHPGAQLPARGPALMARPPMFAVPPAVHPSMAIARRQAVQIPGHYPQDISNQLAALPYLAADAPDPQSLQVQDPTMAQPAQAFGLPPQDLINSLYDIFGSYPRKNVLPYAFSFNLLAATGNNLTPLGTQRPSIKITADAAMITTLITGASTGEYSIFMRTDSSDRQLMQFPIHSAAMVGTAERPFVLPKPLLLAPNTTVSFDIVDLSNANNDVWFTLWGFKVYRRQYAAAG